MAAAKKKEEKVEEVKPFKVDQDGGTKFRFDFKNWEDYTKYRGRKG